ncbi:hypothetical protein M409DRAFT_69881 [Zasmidium cellare ATCC 36951]|uniref:Fe2OG dioxygenase domain-containing protein n=1 Tax=Zasmidium cellare ATCC 36951 TaxID=1080233 RepID=A0A6A6C2Q4_ZASCE|nr:uncharacterized protein M409DRAFT_69881 [Zasmidium cellare ATCC 36951]KAF2161275.1 hypothetical protein M409DRAFT_69881 [Zasmidium cellare ATCC 36951]
MGSLQEEQAQIPVIDISPANKNAPAELLDAACRFGFVFVANNEAGISPELISKVFDISTEFFALPNEVKQEVSIASNKAGKNHGWLSQGVEKLDPKVQVRADVKEAFNMGLPDSKGTFEQPLPSPITQNLSIITSFQSACSSLCDAILTHFATALQIPTDWFTSRHDRTKGPSGTVFRLLYYPQTPTKTDVDIRAGAHSDYGSITCLFQLPGQPGLEIKTPSGDWAPVPVDPLDQAKEGKALPILVNIGDLLEDWTGGLLKSTKHRVVFPKSEEGAGDRYSIAYFCHPLDDALLEPVPSEVVREHVRTHGGKERKVITARDHLMERLAATYSVK